MRKYILALLLLTFGMPVLGEKWLNKNGGDYLGNSQSDPRFFVTCHGGVLAVGNGKLKNAEDKCADSIVGPITGAIRSFDTSARELVLSDSHGNEITFRLTEEELKPLRGLEVGHTVKIEERLGHRSIEVN
jgi:hypothetical protein